MTPHPDSPTDSGEVPNCSFVLDSGRPCRAPARHDSPFCRHHAPDVRARRRRPAEKPGVPSPNPQPSAKDGFDPWILRAYWRTHHRLIPAFDNGELDDTFDMILEALADRQIGPRSAGSLLLAIIDRRRQLAQQAQDAALRALCEQAGRSRTDRLEDLANYLVSASNAGNTPQTRV